MRAPFWFSPDGTSLGFVVTRDLPESLCGESDMWIVDLGGGTPRRLEGVAAFDPQGASWSPDGRRLAFSSWKCDSSVRVFDPS